jgi:hypothetical protein
MNDDSSRERAQKAAIAQVVRRQNVWHTEAGVGLRKLSPEATIDSIELLESEVLLNGDQFSGPVVWYVTLVFPDTEGGKLVSSETFPGIFLGHFENDAPVLDSLDVDFGSLSQAQPTREGNTPPQRSRAARRRPHR